MADQSNNSETALKEASGGYGSADCGAEKGDIDLSLLEESLRLTPWERMLANDDALNFAESLRVAMQRRHAKSHHLAGRVHLGSHSPSCPTVSTVFNFEALGATNNTAGLSRMPPLHAAEK